MRPRHRTAPERTLPAASPRTTPCFDIEVALSGMYPPIWRRFLLRARGTTFADLHRAIQDACGWQDYHLYSFDEATPDGRVGLAQAPADLEDAFDDAPPADTVPLAAWVGPFSPRACRYLYDFGDDWEHDVVVRGVVDVEGSVFRALLGGERAFPPEDCGGLYGFDRVLEFVTTGVDPDPDPHADLGEWLGDWKPDVDLDAVRRSFDATRKPRERR